jgi:hypothetical protein
VAGNQFPSELEVPSAGCWRLALRSRLLRASVVVEAVDPPPAAVCDPSPVYRNTPHPRFGAVTWMPATPRSSGVVAVRFVSTVPGTDGAVIYSGGRAPEGWSTKFLWWAPRPGAGLRIIGRRLDGVGRFDQAFASASSDGEIIFPSIVDVPEAGCWAVTVQTGVSAGLVVFRAIPSG